MMYVIPLEYVYLLKRKPFIFLLSFGVLGLVLRLYSFTSITFAYDQARDAIYAYNIWHGSFKILGPNSDIHGLHHGVLYWYLISPFYFFSNHNIYAVKIFLIFLNLLSIPIIYILAKKMFGKVFIALLASLFCTISYTVIQYSHWLSNPSPAVVTIAISFLFLWKYVQGYKKGLIFAVFFWGLSVNFEIFLIYQIGVFFLILFIFRKLNIRDIILALIVGAVTLSPFLVAEIRFHFMGSRALLDFFHGYAASRGQTLTEMGTRAVSKLISVFYYEVFANNFVAPVIGAVLISLSAHSIIRKRDKKILFLFLWFMSPIVLFFIGGTNIYFAFIGVSVPLSILLSYYISRLLKEKNGKILIGFIILLIFGSNMFLLINNYGKGETLFSVQKNMVLNDEEHVIDWMYKESALKHFRINSITNPLFINTTWSYLFDWYGRGKYGYMPFWWGYPQNGQLGDSIMYDTDFNGSKKLLFLIIEPNTGIPDYYVNAIIKLEDTRSKVIAREKIGEFIVEKRIITKDQPFLMEDLDTIIKTTNY